MTTSLTAISDLKEEEILGCCRALQKAWFCGPPGQVIDGIRSIEAKYPGLEDYMIHWAEGLSPHEFEEQLRWFARDVMPAFSGG